MLLFPARNTQIRPIQMSLHSYLTFWCRVQREELIVAYVVEKWRLIMETISSLFYSQKPCI